MTGDELSGRAGISRRTLQKIERGDPKCEIGLVFEVANLPQLVRSTVKVHDEFFLMPLPVSPNFHMFRFTHQAAILPEP